MDFFLFSWLVHAEALHKVPTKGGLRFSQLIEIKGVRTDN